MEEPATDKFAHVCKLPAVAWLVSSQPAHCLIFVIHYGTLIIHSPLMTMSEAQEAWPAAKGKKVETVNLRDTARHAWHGPPAQEAFLQGLGAAE